MAKLTWLDDIHYPAEYVVRVKGQNPFKVADMMPRLLREVLRVQTKDIFEHDVRWDVTGEPRSFYGFWEGKRTEDRWTRTHVRVTIQGEQASDGSGNIHIRLRGFILTSYEYSNFIQRTFWWFYNRFFYNRQRRNYLMRGKDNIHEIKQKILRAFEVSQEEVSK